MTVEDFRGFFPGSKQPLPLLDDGPPVKSAVRRVQSIEWDAKPLRKNVRGTEVEFFTIGALAAALSKSAVSIRAWIRDGRLPEASYRMPEKNGILGRRLYTRPQIEAIIAVAKAHGLIDSARVLWLDHPTFAAEVRQSWADLPPL